MQEKICKSDREIYSIAGWSSSAKFLCVLGFLVTLVACDTDGNYQEPVADANSIRTPSQIKPKLLGDECNNSLEATLSVGDKSTKLTQNGDSWSGTLNGLSAGLTTARIEFSCLSGSSRLILASAEKQVTVNEGGTELAYANNDYSTNHDNDGDGSSNLEEIEVGADPLSTSSIAASPGNDSFNNAMDITPGVTIRARAEANATNTFVSGSNSPDYYRIQVTEHADYHITATDFGDADIDLYLYRDPDSGSIENNLRSRARYRSPEVDYDEIEYDISTSEGVSYFLKAENFSSNEGNYTLTFDKVIDTGGIAAPFFAPQYMTSREPDAGSGRVKTFTSSIGRVNTTEDRVDVYGFIPQVTGDFELELSFGYNCCTSDSSNVDLYVYQPLDGNVGDPIASGQTSEFDSDQGLDIITLTVSLEVGLAYFFEIRGVNTKGVSEQYLLIVQTL